MDSENLLVTGGCGFIGSNFIRHLLAKEGFRGRIINADSLTYAGNPDNLSGVAEAHPGRYLFEKADICDLPALRAIFARVRDRRRLPFCRRVPCGPLHQAAGQLHPDQYHRDIQSSRSGKGRRQPLPALPPHQHRRGLRKPRPGGAFTEETPYRPNSPYSASKASSDHLVRAYHETYGLPTTISNCSNNYGPYQFPEKLIPLIVLNALEGKPLPVYGDGKNVRDWLYVTDHCEAIRTIMEKGRRGETYNIGGHAEMENIAIVEMICDLVDELAPAEGFPAASDHIRHGPARPRPAVCHRFFEAARGTGLVSRGILRLGSPEDRALVSREPGLERADPKRRVSVLDPGAIRQQVIKARVWRLSA